MAGLPAARRKSRPFSLYVTPRVGKQYVPYLRRHLRAARAELRSRVHELSVALVGDKEMTGLHERFMGISGPTDVLTFPLEEDEFGRVTAGELILCVPQARRQAKMQRISAQNELLLYALHGLLHLSGFDDRTPAGFAQMHRKEDEILTALGVGPVFTPRQTRHHHRPGGER
jgi:probable rRNA maturation factor